MNKFLYFIVILFVCCSKTESSAELELEAFIKKENNATAAINAIKRIENQKTDERVSLLNKALMVKNMQVALAVLDALGKVGNEKSSVYAIIQFSERKPSTIKQRAIEAVEQIGGKEAAAWLFMLSTGHNDEAVRKNAEVALAHVEKKLALRAN